MTLLKCLVLFIAVLSALTAIEACAQDSVAGELADRLNEGWEIKHFASSAKLYSFILQRGHEYLLCEMPVDLNDGVEVVSECFRLNRAF